VSINILCHLPENTRASTHTHTHTQIHTHTHTHTQMYEGQVLSAIARFATLNVSNFDVSYDDSDSGGSGGGGDGGGYGGGGWEGGVGGGGGGGGGYVTAIVPPLVGGGGGTRRSMTAVAPSVWAGGLMGDAWEQLVFGSDDSYDDSSAP